MSVLCTKKTLLLSLIYFYFVCLFVLFTLYSINYFREQSNTKLLKRLLEVITQIEEDYEVLKDNEQKLEHMTGVLLKCMQQTTNAQKQKLTIIKEIHSSHMKE